MSSILTNTSAMVALQTLKSINSNLSDTMGEISTGKSVANAKDNAAIWAISKVMESDVNGFKAISESLSLGESTVSVARQATETVTDLLTEIKGKIVASQEDNVDRGKIQTDITALRDQIKSVVDTAQFNGLNLLKGTETVDILSSLNRSSDGSVQAANISIDRQDLTFEAGTYGTGSSLSANATASAATIASTANNTTVTIGGTIVAGEQFNVDIAGQTVSFIAATTSTDDVATGLSAALNAAGIEGISASVASSVITVGSTRAFESTSIATSTNSAAGTNVAAASEISERAENVTFSAGVQVAAGDSYRVAVGGVNYDYVAGNGENMGDVARGLKAAIDGGDIPNITTNVANNGGTYSLQIDNSGASLSLSAAGAADGQATGGLVALNGIDVSTNEGAEKALSNIETLIQTGIDSAAQFGSAQGRIDIQNTFIGKMTDALKSGIGSMVDADMEETSARLQALQVQQQLGTQSLSIANQKPQSILSLFR
ncbi:MAG: flagellin [Halocynthiibacter sp.]